MTNMLPFTRPTLDEETIQSVVEVLRSGWLATGPKVAALEKELSAYLGGRPVRTQTSATAGMEMALRACGIGAGDEVIVDVGLDSRNINLDQVEAAITPRTRAIMPVHFAGLPVNMDRLYEIASEHKLRVIEDAAHAIGSAWRGKQLGSFGDLVCFSFHPNKNMTTIEGGAISGGSADELKAIELERWHGQVKSGVDGFDTLIAGGKSNLSDVAAAVGLGQLRRLEEFNARRRQLVGRYYDLWKDNPPVRLPERGDEGHSWHVFSPLLPLDEVRITRPQFIEAMKAEGIAVGVHYPAIHLFTFYRAMGYHEGQFPNAERIGRQTVTLPLFPTMQMEDVDRVVASVTKVLRGAR
jgi:dTDP-4-amino-4,6-dideoxygalactose transaminase